MLVQTEINGIYCMRMAIGAQRTTEKHIRDAFNIFEEEASRAIEAWKQKPARRDRKNVDIVHHDTPIIHQSLLSIFFSSLAKLLISSPWRLTQG